MLTKTPIHRSLLRPILLLGADRELVLVLGLVVVILVFVLLTVLSALLGVALWMLCVGLLRMMAKQDPLMRHVYIRHIKYRSYYRPTSTPWRRY